MQYEKIGNNLYTNNKVRSNNVFKNDLFNQNEQLIIMKK